ncbi:MAG: hypothetical protein O3B13_07865 [Planctomycetota bacterium]|nr:hypothetical protein [Planctomycetota bacterium]MDA1163001.1 hypothetical protein [Planctomycetota bacterium]
MKFIRRQETKFTPLTIRLAPGESGTRDPAGEDAVVVTLAPVLPAASMRATDETDAIWRGDPHLPRSSD